MGIYKGIVKGSWIKMKDKVFLPEGTEVEIVVEEPLASFRKGSPSSILRAIQSAPPLKKEEIEDLRQAISKGKTAVDWSSPLDYDGSKGE